MSTGGTGSGILPPWIGGLSLSSSMCSRRSGSSPATSRPTCAPRSRGERPATRSAGPRSSFSGRFDRWLNAPGGSAVAISGLLTLWIYGLPLTTPWVLSSAILFLAVLGLGIIYWRRFGQAVGSAVSASDWPGVRRLLNEPRVVLVSRLENVAVLAILVLMILRPA